jgi:putative acetyltransferase
VTLDVNQRPRRRHTGDLGIAVDERYQGRGIGTAMMGAILDLADDWLGLHRVELTVLASNDHAIRMYRRFGFEVEGTLRDWSLNEGEFADVLMMGRLRHEVRASNRPPVPG